MTNFKKRVPRLAFFEITEACNLRCTHCEVSAGHRDKEELSTDEALNVADQLADAGCQQVNLTGGEPLVRPDWPLIARRFVERGVMVTMITNGLLVDKAMACRLVEAGVQNAAVSLDGDREVHDSIRAFAGRSRRSSYDAALSALAFLRAAGLRTAVITQVHRRNLRRLQDLHDTVAEFGVDRWQVQIAMPLGRLLDVRYEYLIDPADIPFLEAELVRFIDTGKVTVAVGDNIGYYGSSEPKLRGAAAGTCSFFQGCVAGMRVVAIRSNGDVKGCASHPTSFVVGNLRRERFDEIWRDTRRFPYNTAFCEKNLVGGCATCEFGKVCRAGCTTMAYAITGTIYDNPFCTQRARLERETRG